MGGKFSWSVFMIDKTGKLFYEDVFICIIIFLFVETLPFLSYTNDDIERVICLASGLVTRGTYGRGLNF